MMKLIAQMAGEKMGDEFEAVLDESVHAAFYRDAHFNSDRYPLLSRLNPFSDARFAHSELEPLIHEVEHATIDLKPDHPMKRFFEPFHSLCCMAFCQGREIVISRE